MAETTVELGEPARTEAAAEIGTVRTVSAPEYVDVRIPAAFAPFDVTAEAEAVGITVYNRRAGEGRIGTGGDAFIGGGRWTQAVAEWA